MKTVLFYISDGEMLMHTPSAVTPLKSGVLEAYLKKLRESAKRNEWKNSGKGAKFTGTYTPGSDVESKLASVRANVRCVGMHDNDLIYSIDINGVSGIYRKLTPDDVNEGIVSGSGEYSFGDFSIRGDRMLVSSSFAGESHIGILDIASGHCVYYTDGHSWDFEPVWSASRPERFYFCTSGLKIDSTQKERESAGFTSVPQLMLQMASSSVPAVKGAASICMIDTSNGTMRELLCDGSFDYVHPQSLPDGSLFYIRKPYKQKKDRTFGGCLLDIILFPFRLLASLFGFMNYFSMKYSGKALSKAGDIKNSDEGKLFIDGNLIEAEKELKANRSHGDRFPGIIPRSWELHRLFADGTDELIRRGVLAYRVTADNEIYISNGSCVLLRRENGEESKVSDTPRVTFIEVGAQMSSSQQ